MQTEQTENTHPHTVCNLPRDQCMAVCEGVVYAKVPSRWQLRTGRGWEWKGVGHFGEMNFGAMNIKKNRDTGFYLNQKSHDKK